MLHVDITLTDIALAVECAVFCTLLLRRNTGDPSARRVFIALFAALATASLFGAIWHGALSDQDTSVARVIWFAAMCTLALSATALWYLAAILLQTGFWPAAFRIFAWLQLVVQILISALLSDAFGVAALGVLPPLVIVTILYFRHYSATRAPLALTGALGFALAILSGLVVVFEVSLHPRWASPFAVYHVLQFIALWLVFLSVPAVVLRQPETA